MDDQAAVRGGYRPGHLQEQLHGGARVQRMFVTPAADVHAINQRHGQPGRAVLGDAGVEQADDVRVPQAREDSRFALEALGTVPAQRCDGQYLEGNFLIDGAIHATCTIDHGHAAATEFAADFPVTQAATTHGHRFRPVLGSCCCRQARILVVEPGLLVCAGQHAQQMPTHGFGCRQGFQSPLARLRVKLDQLGEQAICVLPG